MCGIFGNYSIKISNDPVKALSALRSAQHALNHRGPDDHGLETYAVEHRLNDHPGSLSIGHTRLSIIDLTAGGHQPMHSSEGRFTIVFNGEIYNYRELRSELKTSGFRFLTDSDTEVLLAAWRYWGLACLRRFIGMFAFAVYDRHDQSLTLARDAFGIKPLYFSLDENYFSFASEIPALLKLLPQKPELNLQRAYDYLAHGRYDDRDQTFFKGVTSLLPGHILRVNLRSISSSVTERWWWPAIDERFDISFAEATVQLREMFLKNIELHLRSDVPVGAALSGGLDSSAVVCAMRYLEPNIPIHTFTYVAKGTAINEESWADIVNKHVCAIEHKVFIEPNELIEDLGDIIQLQGEPFGGTSIYAQYRIYKLAHSIGIKVVLDGQGADELLAGYNGYPSEYLQSLIDEYKYIEALQFLKGWSQWPGRGINSAAKILLAKMVPEIFRKVFDHNARRANAPSWLNTKYLSEQGVNLDAFATKRSPEDAKGRRLANVMRESLTGNGLASLLRHGDRNSMRWSVECRVPFLTIEMAEFLLSLPESFLLGPDGQTKRILRAAMQGIVPDQILYRRDKIGFETPQSSWLNTHREEIQRMMTEKSLPPFVDVDVQRKRRNEVHEAEDHTGAHSWRLLNYCRWTESTDPINIEKK
jgi:asparagine synthase (glutamine-hydrolysing)